MKISFLIGFPVVDFGIAGILSNIPVDNIHAGTLKYLAPETFDKKSNQNLVSPALDVWSIGCILFALVTGGLPFKGNSSKTIVEKIKMCEYAYPPDLSLSMEVRELIGRCLDVNPKSRISMGEISEHVWCTGDVL